MSALEHIRKRPALVISILGLALFLFIITAVTDNFAALFGDRDTAVKVDGKKLKYDQWKRTSSRISDSYRQQGREMTDPTEADEMALQQIIDEELLNEAIEKSGITVTDDEMQQYLFGPASLIAGEVQKYNFQSPEAMYQYAYSNDPDADTFRAIWQDIENRLHRQLLIAKYQMQLGAITANKLDAKAFYDENRNLSVNLAKVDLASLNDGDFKIEDKDINDLYNKEKERFKLDSEVRLVDYILVTPTPSAEDENAASTEIIDVIAKLKAMPGTEAIAGNYNYETKVITGRESALTPSLRNALERIQQDTVAMLSYSGSTYNLAKILDSAVKADTAYVNFYLTENATVPVDSVVAAINAGSDLAQYGDSVQKFIDRQVVLVGESPLAFYADNFTNASSAAAVTDAGLKSQIIKYIFGGQVDPSQIDFDQLGIACKVNKLSNPATIYEIASISRKVVPSEQTITALRSQLNDYKNKNNTADNFSKNIANSSFNIESGRVTPQRFAVIAQNGQRIPQTVSAVRWALEDAKKGDVSDIYNLGDNGFIVLAVKDIYDGAYIPVSDASVKDQLTQELLADKKGAKLVADYNGKGKSVEEYAAAMNTTPIQSYANYAQNDGGRIFMDPKYLAAVGAAQKGSLVGPVATNSAVVVFEITDDDAPASEFDFKAIAPQAAQLFNISNTFNMILRGDKDIDYKALRFESNN